MGKNWLPKKLEAIKVIDYRLLLHHGSDRNPKKLRKLFIRKTDLAINEYNFENKTNYKYVENRTQAMTIKLLSKKRNLWTSY